MNRKIIFMMAFLIFVFITTLAFGIACLFPIEFKIRIGIGLAAGFFSTLDYLIVASLPRNEE